MKLLSRMRSTINNVPLTELVFDEGNAFAEKAASAIALRVCFFLLSFAKWTYAARLRRAFYRNAQRKCHSPQKFLAIILQPSQPINANAKRQHAYVSLSLLVIPICDQLQRLSINYFREFTSVSHVTSFPLFFIRVLSRTLFAAKLISSLESRSLKGLAAFRTKIFPAKSIYSDFRLLQAHYQSFRNDSRYFLDFTDPGRTSSALCLLLPLYFFGIKHL